MTISLALPPYPQPKWKEEFGSIHGLRRYEEARKPLLDRVSQWPQELADFASERWHSIAGEHSKPISSADFQRMYDANRDLQALSSELESLKLNATTSDGELIEWAERCANLCNVWPRAANWIALRVGL